MKSLYTSSDRRAPCQAAIGKGFTMSKSNKRRAQVPIAPWLDVRVWLLGGGIVAQVVHVWASQMV